VDYRLALTEAELVGHVGRPAFDAAAVCFGGAFDTIKLRRVEAARLLQLDHALPCTVMLL
jgi:hypothetical protein